jgi:hypothetical protein
MHVPARNTSAEGASSKKRAASYNSLDSGDSSESTNSPTGKAGSPRKAAPAVIHHSYERDEIDHNAVDPSSGKATNNLKPSAVAAANRHRAAADQNNAATGGRRHAVQEGEEVKESADGNPPPGLYPTLASDKHNSYVGVPTSDTAGNQDRNRLNRSGSDSVNLPPVDAESVPLSCNVRIEDKEHWTMATYWFMPVTRIGFILFVLLSPFPSFFVLQSNFKKKETTTTNTSGGRRLLSFFLAGLEDYYQPMQEQDIYGSSLDHLQEVDRRQLQTISVSSSYGRWGQNIKAVSWVVLIVLFFSAFSQYMKYAPVMSGRPKELLRSVPECKGKAVVSVVTPIVDEDYALFLRSLLGRALTVFHTVANKEHKIQGLYVDTIINEERRGKVMEIRNIVWKAFNYFLLEVVLITSELTPENLNFRTKSNGVPAVEVPFTCMEKLIQFLEIWLEKVVANELTYNYCMSVNLQTEKDV